MEPADAYFEGNCDFEAVDSVALHVVALEFVVDASAEQFVTVDYVAV